MTIIQTRRLLKQATAGLLAAAFSLTASGQILNLPKSGLDLTDEDRKLTSGMYACINDRVQNGLPIREAVAQCNEQLSRLQEFIAANSAFGAGLIALGTKPSTTVPDVAGSCGGSADPTRSEDKAPKDGGAAEGEVIVTIGDIEVIERVNTSVDGKTVQTFEFNKPTVITGSSGGSKDGGTKQESGEGVCEAVADEARNVIAECNRTDWKNTVCQQIVALVNGCPDPTQIYVDPEQGYACGASADPETARVAYEGICRELARGGPDRDPCTPFDPNGAGMVFNGPPGDLCSDPKARTESDECFGVIEVRDPTGAKTWQEYVVWGQSVFGGPTFVFPTSGGGALPLACRLTRC